jgi:hypothetical protein
VLKELKKLVLFLAAVSSKGKEANKLYAKLDKKMQNSLSDDDDDSEGDFEDDEEEEEDDSFSGSVEEDEEDDDDDENDDEDSDEDEEANDEEDEKLSFEEARRAFKRKHPHEVYGVHLHHRSQPKSTTLSSFIFPSRKIAPGSKPSPDFVEEIAKVEKYNAELARKGKKRNGAAATSVTFSRDHDSDERARVSSGLQSRFPSSSSSSAPRASTTAEWLAKLKASKSSASASASSSSSTTTVVPAKGPSPSPFVVSSKPSPSATSVLDKADVNCDAPVLQVDSVAVVDK